MSKIDRINQKITDISKVFDVEFEEVRDCLNRRDFKSLDIALSRRKSTAKALRCLLTMLDIEKKKAVKLSLATY